MTSAEGMGEATVDSGKKAVAFLKKPQGLILLALAAGAGYLWWTRGTNAAAVAEVPAEQTPVGGYTDEREPPGSASGSSPPTTVPTDNAQWHTAALALLTGLGFDSAFADSSLSQYLGGEPLSTKEKAVISLALARLGAPPNGAPSIVDEPPPTTNPPPNTTGVPKPKGTVYRIAQKGDSWTYYIGQYFSHGGPATTDVTALATWSALHGGSPVVTPGVKIALPTSTPGFTGVPWTS